MFRVVSRTGADAVSLTDVMLALEEHFEIEITNDEAATLTTLGDVVTYLDAKGFHAEP